MPSLNIKDYIIAALLVIIIGMGVILGYKQTKLSYYESYKEQAELLAKEQEKRIEVIKEESKKTEEYLNEKYEVELSIINRTVDGLRQHNTSILSSIPKSTSDPNRICFKRQELDEAIRGFTGEVSEIARKGSVATIGLNTCKEWVEEELEIYDQSNKSD